MSFIVALRIGDLTGSTHAPPVRLGFLLAAVGDLTLLAAAGSGSWACW
jgi:hypothetical protein